MKEPDDNLLAIERAGAILDQLGMGILALDPSGQVASYNACARSLFSRHMRVVRSTVTFADPSDLCRYSDRVEALCGSGTDPAPVDPMVVARAGASPLLIKFVPAPLAGEGSARRVSGIVLLRQVEAHGDISEARIRSAFGLTASEARLAARLSGGATLAEAARDLNISNNTARVHLRSVFRKTDTSRQSRLISLLSSLV